jgi:hypothetical protein
MKSKPLLSRNQSKAIAPTGIDSIDALAALRPQDCKIEAYIKAASEYVRRSAELKPGPKKAGQIRLSNALGRVLASSLKEKLPELRDVVIGERKVSGALRSVNADVSEIHPTDGLRLAVELKPVNLAVGRAIWNRFGDIRTFAVNLHLKFPFCVVGGVLVIPTYEETGTGAAEAAIAEESEASLSESLEGTSTGPDAIRVKHERPGRKSTLHLIERAISRLIRAGGRKTEGDAPHLLEGIAVIVYNPDDGIIVNEIPQAGTGLRWDEFIESMTSAYRGRFEDI